MSSSGEHSIAFDKLNRKAWMWGSNDYGLLGFGLSNATIDFPVEVPNYQNYSQLFSFGYTTFATETVIDSEGRSRNRLAYVWGYNRVGQFGIGNTSTSLGSTPIAFTDYDIYVKFISGGYLAPFIVTDDNQVLTSGHSCCIGRDPSPASLPPAYFPTPATSSYDPQYRFLPVPNIPSDVEITSGAGGDYVNAILTSDGRVFCWGLYSGEWATDNNGTRPQEVHFTSVLDPGDFIVQIHAVHLQFYATSQRGKVVYWGNLNNDVPANITMTPHIFEPLADYFVQSFLYQDPHSKTSSDSISACALARLKSDNCTGTPPTSDYVCVGGIWSIRNPIVSLNSITFTTEISVSGSLSIDSTTFQGLKASLSVEECFYSQSILLDLSGSTTTTQSGSRITILHQSSECGDTLSGTQVDVKTSDQSCRKTTGTLASQNDGSGRASYSIVFKVRTFACKRWWIILVSLLGGVALLVLAFGLVTTYVKPVKEKIRPFWARGHRH
jgi:hypothetical protein